MLIDNSLAESKHLEIGHIISENCKNRIKPMMLRDVKTEALLVFARTALERFFENLDENNLQPFIGTEADTAYIYTTLRDLSQRLQECVVNVDYLINLVQSAKTYPELRRLAKHEEPLIAYYDVMAHKVANYFSDKPAYIPEFLIICTLSHWILEEEKSVALYPFLKEIDFALLIDTFETYRHEFEKENVCLITDIHNVSLVIVEKLKNKKYKANKQRASKTRKKK